MWDILGRDKNDEDEVKEGSLIDVAKVDADGEEQLYRWWGRRMLGKEEIVQRNYILMSPTGSSKDKGSVWE